MNFILERLQNALSEHTMPVIYAIISITALIYLIWDLKNFKNNQLSRQINSRIGRINKEEKKSNFDIMSYFDIFLKKKNKKTKIELELAGIPFSVKEYNVLLVSSAGIGFLIGTIIFPLGPLWNGLFGFIENLALRDFIARIFLGSLIAFGGTFIPSLYVKLQVDKKRKTLDSQIQDALLNLADALHSGFVINAAIKVLGEDLPSPMGLEFEKTHKEIDSGKSLHEALTALKERVNLSDLDIAINAIIIQDELGGKLETLLRTIVQVIIERQELKKEIEKTIANSKMVGMILMAAPIFFCIVFFMMNKEQTTLLVSSKLGILLSISAVIAYGVAIFFITKIIRDASSDL